VTGNTVVLAVALLVWVLLWAYLLRLERRIKELERR
jgi:CcmD family protein